MSDQPIHQAPPPLRKPPAEDPARYIAWLAKRGTPLGANPTGAANPDDKAREDVALRIGDWGFFEHGVKIGDARDRAALDRADHAVVPSEKTDKGDWYALLTLKGLDAKAAFDRAAWLYRASTVEPSPAHPKVTAPTLTAGGDSVKLQGWVVYPPNMGRPMRLTITATAKGVKIANESPDSL